MNRLAYALVLLAALIHAGFSLVEICFWNHPRVHERITYILPESGTRHAFDSKTSYIAAPIVANAGIYNGFLSAGLFWGLFARKRQQSIRYFFLWCALIAGLFGAFTLWSAGPLFLQTAVACAAIFAIARSKPSPAWELGREYPPADEQADIDEVVRISSVLQSMANPKPLRGQHAKPTGAVRGKLIVGHSNDPRAASGIFREPNKVYDVYIRFSNGVGRLQPDWQKDARGMSMKVLGVKGSRCLPTEEDPSVQDFVMINFPAFPVRNAEQYVSFLALRRIFARFRNGNKIAALTFFIPWRLQQFRTVGRKIQRATNSVLDEKYWSMSAYRLGQNAIKFSVAPTHVASLSSTDGATRSSDFLSQELKDRIHDQKVVLSFRVQFQEDPYQTPIEDPTIIWEEKLSPPIEVARIEIEKGALDSNKSDSSLQDQIEEMAFNPWHSIEEHRPLGGINRLRKVVYHASALARRGRVS